MRNKLILPTLSVAIVVVLAALSVAVSLSTSGSAQNNYEERLDNLETRVAVLEEKVGIDHEALQSSQEVSQSNQVSQQSNVSTSSSQSTVSGSSDQSVGTYSGSFTSSGDGTFDVEIDNAGTYMLVATAGSPFELELVNADGEPVAAFSLASDEPDTMTATAELEPGLYTLRVNADATWNVTITSSGG